MLGTHGGLGIHLQGLFAQRAFGVELRDPHPKLVVRCFDLDRGVPGNLAGPLRQGRRHGRRIERPRAQLQAGRQTRLPPQATGEASFGACHADAQRIEFDSLGIGHGLKVHTHRFEIGG